MEAKAGSQQGWSCAFIAARPEGGREGGREDDGGESGTRITYQSRSVQDNLEGARFTADRDWKVKYPKLYLWSYKKQTGKGPKSPRVSSKHTFWKAGLTKQPPQKAGRQMSQLEKLCGSLEKHKKSQSRCCINCLQRPRNTRLGKLTLLSQGTRVKAKDNAL